ncbi:Uncharacterized conserved protein YbjT, contains NAD(P)-binding and DUF2867 domains [Fictibacillus solisalsi]|uniref:Uncharacterized conserved protein YbjT, contains NAD(P)-binding and DUF2867 domains n=1 Tax=Fictibacillus solisalsi TaxID=459525 RepID=A0A1H0A6P3_9BACL|nr:SDR family oxidoreductase [Fictibacillus solisalsi]SDN29288.1 Uncharacterized conserved protein YbjT, contains NAD(P)-binding and DUF2867 domains [Fictibacillus solisalsi]
MKVFLVGANGQIGQKLVKLLADSPEHEVTAMIRNPDQAGDLEKIGAQTAVANLEGSVDDLAAAVKGHDAVIFSAGSGGSTGSDKTLLVDLDGAVKVMEAAEQSGVNRFVMVSALQAHNRENWNEKIKPYYVAKHYADKALEASELNYTIVRPGGLLNKPATGKVQAGENLERSSIPREDVAQTVFTALTEENTFKRGFDLTSGEQSISDALKNL